MFISIQDSKNCLKPNWDYLEKGKEMMIDLHFSDISWRSWFYNAKQ